MNHGVFVGFCDDSGTFTLDHKAQFFAYVAAKFKGCEVELEVRKRRTKRSLRANAALHACLSEWSVWLAKANTPADVEQLKDDLLALCWGYVVRQSVLTGEIVKELVKPHTADLTVEEFTQLFDVAVVEAAKTGFVMTLPDEYNARKQAEVTAQKKANSRRKVA